MSGQLSVCGGGVGCSGSHVYVAGVVWRRAKIQTKSMSLVVVMEIWKYKRLETPKLSTCI